MSYFTRKKSLFLPMGLLESAPSPEASGNAAPPYLSFQERERLIEACARSMGYPTTTGNGEGYEEDELHSPILP